MVEIEIGTIQVDTELQQRDLDESIANHYTALIRDGHEFPAVSICEETTGESQEKTRRLYDGFHRVEAAKRAGLSKISAQIVQGSKRDALWLSFAANKDHGLPRKPGQTKAVIKRILQDPEWRNKSLAAVARHVGVSRQYVSRINAELNLSTSCGQPDLETATLEELEEMIEEDLRCFRASLHWLHERLRERLREGYNGFVWKGLDYPTWCDCLKGIADEMDIDAEMLADANMSKWEFFVCMVGEDVLSWSDDGEEDQAVGEVEH